MNNNFSKQNNNKKAFTLVEALVAISILMIAIAGPMTLAQKSLSTAILSKDQMIAGFLAQDAIEAVKNIRDQIAVSQTTGDWLAGNGVLSLTPCVCNLNGDKCNFTSSNFNYCTIDTTAPTWAVSTFFTSPQGIDAGGSQTTLLTMTYNKNLSTGATSFLKYGYDKVSSPSPGTTVLASKFTRYINIKENPSGTNPDEAVINVRISWNSALGPQNLDVQSFIYNYSVNL